MASSLTDRLCLQFAEVARQIKATNQNVGNLNELMGVAAGSPSLVAAINALVTEINNITVIDDVNVSTTTTFSSQEIVDRLVQLETDILGGIPPVTLDTIAELAAAIQANDLDIMGLVSFTTDQTGSVTSEQQQQARDNIDVFGRAEIGDIAKDFNTVFLTALEGPIVTLGATFTTNGNPVTIDLAFDEPIAPASLAATEVSLVNTDTDTIRTDGVLSIAGDNLSATVTFATPNDAGNYEARIDDDAVIDGDGNTSGPTAAFTFVLPA